MTCSLLFQSLFFAATGVDSVAESDDIGLLQASRVLFSGASSVAETDIVELDTCRRPNFWCSHSGSSYSDAQDCDGDGIPDPYCQDTSGQTGFIGSASGCTGNWPSGKCGNVKAMCLRHNGWCSHAGSSYFAEIDCDGDGIPDPFCTDTGGRSGFIGSNGGCASTWPSGGCINANDAKAACLRPPGWCVHGGSSYSVDMDCDGDSIPDPLCKDTAGHSGFIGSASGCTGNWPSGTCGKNVCNRPNGWCSHGGSSYSGETDCDGDGIPDPFCKDTHGSSGFIGSNGGCADNWPHGPKSCQSTFLVIKGSANKKGIRRYECAKAETSQMDSSIRVRNREFATVCCKESGEGFRPSCDWHDVTRPEAVAHCAGVGLRLCSAQELRDGAGQSVRSGFPSKTGNFCKYNGHFIWSSTTCP